MFAAMGTKQRRELPPPRVRASAREAEAFLTGTSKAERAPWDSGPHWRAKVLAMVTGKSVDIVDDGGEVLFTAESRA